MGEPKLIQPSLETAKSPFQDLQTKGFVVIRNYFSPDELATLRKEYEERPFEPNGNFNLKLSTPEVMQKFKNTFARTLNEIHTHTDIKADLISEAYYFDIDAGTNFAWHQDNESYYIGQDHFNYLNFYIPIFKPDPTKSGLCVIPWDVFSSRVPHVAKELIGGGACRARFKNGKTYFYDDARGGVREVPFNVEEMGVTPHLNAGDLLCMRGDVFHRTQDVDTKRTSISIRFVYSKGIVKKEVLEENLCLTKAIMKANNSDPYRRRLKCFTVAGKDELEVAEYNRLFDEIVAKESVNEKLYSTPIAALDEEVIKNFIRLIGFEKNVRVILLDRVPSAEILDSFRREISKFGAAVLIAHGSESDLLKGRSRECRGQLDRAPLLFSSRFDTTARLLAQAGFQIFGMKGSGEAPSLRKADLSGRVAFVCPSVENEPLLPETLRHCTQFFHIPTAHEEINQVNGPTAAALALYEVVQAHGLSKIYI